MSTLTVALMVVAADGDDGDDDGDAALDGDEDGDADGGEKDDDASAVVAACGC